MESLSGYFLISTPQMPDPRFQEQVVYLCVHNDEGAMGLVINHPYHGLNLTDIFQRTDLAEKDRKYPPVYLGGPVDLEAGFILHSADYSSEYTLVITPEVSLSRDLNLLKAIGCGEGPAQYLFLLGYAGWGPGQLEKELGDNGWLTLPGDPTILFETADELKWKQAAGKYGINITMLGSTVGNA